MTWRRCGSWWSGGRRSRRIGRCCSMSGIGGSASGSSRRGRSVTAAGFYELGVREGTAVTWQLPTRMETVVASMALSRLGAVQNPIIPIYRQREVGFLLRETSAEWFLVPGSWRGFDYLEMATGLAKEMERPPTVMVVYDSLPEGDPGGLPPVPVVPADPVDQPVRWIYSTSGTTSDPKGVRHTDATLIAGGIGLVESVGHVTRPMSAPSPSPTPTSAGPTTSITAPGRRLPGHTPRDVRTRRGRARSCAATAPPWPEAGRRLLSGVRQRAVEAAGRADHSHPPAGLRWRGAEAAGGVLRGRTGDAHPLRPRDGHDRGAHGLPWAARMTPTSSWPTPTASRSAAPRSRSSTTTASRSRRDTDRRAAGAGADGLQGLHPPRAHRHRLRRGGLLPDGRPGPPPSRRPSWC